MTNAGPNIPGDYCRFFISIDEPYCGKPAVTDVKVSTRLIQGTVPLCTRHKAIHDENAASIRAAHKVSK